MSNGERWTEARGRLVVREWRRSGLSMAAFAASQGVEAHRLRYWRGRVEDAVPGSAAPREVLRLVPGVLTGGSGGGVVVTLPRGVAVEALSTVVLDPAWLARVVRALEGAS